MITNVLLPSNEMFNLEEEVTEWVPPPIKIVSPLADAVTASDK